MLPASAKVWCIRAIAVSLLSLLAGLSVLVLADIGGPVWLFVLLGAWLWTIGLPTTAAVAVAAALWGQAPLLMTNTLLPFLAFAAVVGVLSQVAVFVLLGRFLRNRAGRPLR